MKKNIVSLLLVFLTWAIPMICLGANEFGEEAKPDTTKARAINGVRAFPDHCYNCVHDKDKGEIDMDCGGPCSPCADAPKTMVVDKAALKTQRWYTASQKLSTANEVTLSNRGYPYELIAGEEMVFNNGFTIDNGVDFSAQVNSNSANFTRQFTHTCKDMKATVFKPNSGDENDVWYISLVGYTWFSLEVMTLGGFPVYTSERNIDRDGKIVLWGGEGHFETYYWRIKLKDYTGKITTSDPAMITVIP